MTTTPLHTIKIATNTRNIGMLHSQVSSSAPLNSPVFTGDPRAPTPPTPDNDTSIATTAFVKNQGYLTGNQTITLSGDVTGSGSTAITTTLATVTVGKGGTGLTSGTSGGVPYFSGTTTMASSALLAANTLVIGGGAGTAPSTSAHWTVANTGNTLTGNNNATAVVNSGAADVINLQQTDATNGIVRLTTFGSGVGASIIAASASGTAASPAALSSVAPLGLSLAGYDGSVWSGVQGRVRMAPYNNPWTTSDHSTVLYVEMTPSGSTTIEATPCATFASNGVQLRGTTLANNATAGFYGEFMTNTASGVSLTTNVTATLCSITLTPGDWDVWGNVQFSPSGVTITNMIGGMSGSGTAVGNHQISGPTMGGCQLPTATVRVSTAANATINLTALAVFGSGTCTGGGNIWARRVR